MTSTIPPGLIRTATDVIVEASRRPILDVEYYRFDGKTSIVEAEMERLRKDAVPPTFDKSPRWHAARDILGFLAGFEGMAVLGIFTAYIGNPSLFWLFGSLLVLGMVGLAVLFHWFMFHLMEIPPRDGKFGNAGPDQAYKGLTLIIRDVVRSNGYGYKLVRAEAILAHNYGFEVIPSEGSKERLHLVVYKHYSSPELNIQITRTASEKRRTYLRFKDAIEDRLARQVI